MRQGSGVEIREMEVEGMGGMEEDSGRQAKGRGGWAVPQGTPIEEAGVRRLGVEKRRGTPRQWQEQGAAVLEVLLTA